MSYPIICTALLGLLAALSAHGRGTGILDLTNLENYADQVVPDYISVDEVPDDNPITDEGATLGRVLFYDKRLSIDNSISCASCHQQAHAFTDALDASIGVDGKTGRHSMRLINLRYSNPGNTTAFWDQRAASLEDQVTQPIQDHVEMGFSGDDGEPDFNDLIDKLSEIPEYQTLFTRAFGDAAIDEERVQKSLAQFIRSIQSFDSRYDEGRVQVDRARTDFPNFTNEENEGKSLFINRPPAGGAGCASCHTVDDFAISNANGGNNGVITDLSGGIDTTNTRSPSLRDLVDAAGVPHSGFMHDASLTTLESVIAHYNDIPPTAGLDGRLGGANAGQSLGLTDQQMNQLVAFLKTLTGSDVYANAKWSDPFDAKGNLTLLTEVFRIFSITSQDSTTNTISWNSIPGKTYTLWASSDLENWETVNGTIPADGSSAQTTIEIEESASAATVFYRISEGATYSEPPNVLLVILDDWGVDASELYQTDTDGAILANMPNIESLAAGGLRFTRAYVNPSCSPTRASILSGRYAHQTGVYSPENSGTFSASETTLPEAIAAAGSEYAIASIGKFHLSNNNDGYSTLGGWPEYYGFNGGGVSDYYNWSKNSNGITSNSTTYTTTDQVDESIAFIQRSEAADQSWFCWLAFNAPHSPFHEPPESLAPAGGYSERADGESQNSWYYRKMLEALDTELGRLLENVDLANTNIILFGDNGTPGQVVQAPFGSEHAKGSIYNGGTNVPFIARGPAVKSASGSTSDHLIHAVDLFPTILDLMGIDPAMVAPADVIGQTNSLLPILQGVDTTARAMIAEGRSPPDSARAIVSGDYPDFKLIIHGNPEDPDQIPTFEFYNTGVPGNDFNEEVPLETGSLSGNALAAYEACIELDAALGGGFSAR